MGSEMCIRDSGGAAPAKGAAKPGVRVKKIRKVKKTA